MLIYIARGADNADRDNLERIKALRALAPDVPLMILSDSQSREEIISTLNVGAQGFLYVGANAELALQAFSFMLNGGSYFLSAMRPKQTYPSQRHPGIDCIPTPVMGRGNGAAKDLEDAGPKLTARQKAVLELLSRGDTKQGYCAPAGDEGRYRQSSCAANHAQVRRDEPHAGRCCLRERPAQPKGGDTS